MRETSQIVRSSPIVRRRERRAGSFGWRTPCAIAATLTLGLGEVAHATSDTEGQVASTGPSSIARQWNEELLDAIRIDFARPTVHARNLFHVSIAMWDSWAAYDDFALNYLHQEKATANDVAAARHETLSYAVYRVLTSRFAHSPGAGSSLPALDQKMAEFGYDIANTRSVGDTPAGLGNRIAAAVLAFGDADTSNEANGYRNRFYQPLNPELVPALAGNPTLLDPNRWQALVLDFFVDQAGHVFPLGVPDFLSPEWGTVTPFALTHEDLTIKRANDNEYWLYHDPGPPPQLGGEGDAAYRSGFEQVLAWSALLDPNDGVMIDIGPGARGGNTLGTNDGTGHPLNPKTGLPYPPNVVPAGDYYRVLAEFWADGPSSETPPGHWFAIANHVSDDPDVVKRIGGVGPVVDDLEWDVKLYLALAGAVHDSAVAAWGVKGWYDFIRPISAIRHLAGNGQSSDPDGPFYDPAGIHLVPGSVEVITSASAAPGERHAHLSGRFNANVGKIAARAWRGPDAVFDPATTTAGVGWILVENWWPYQRPSFVTPPFAGYVSGHSTFSRAAAEVMALFTGDPFFPGGVGTFLAARNEFLVFEEGPSVDVTLQWATYRDASDETSLSRIYGGIHPTADDIPGRRMGAVIGPAAFRLAEIYWGPRKTLELEKLWIDPRGKLSVRGRIRLGIHGDADRLDLSSGVRIAIHDEHGAQLKLALPDCMQWSARSDRCSNPTGTARVRFFTVSDDDVQFELVQTGKPIGAHFEGKMIVELTADKVERAGALSACVTKNGTLTCRQTRSKSTSQSKPRT